MAGKFKRVRTVANTSDEEDFHVGINEIGRLYSVVGLVYKMLDAAIDHKPLSHLLQTLLKHLDYLSIEDMEDQDWSELGVRYMEWGELLRSDHYKYIYRSEWSGQIAFTHEPIEEESVTSNDQS